MEELSDEQIKIFKAMTPPRKLEIALNMYHMARELKAARIRETRPDWSKEKIEEAVREIFINARS